MEWRNHTGFHGRTPHAAWALPGSTLTRAAQYACKARMTREQDEAKFKFPDKSKPQAASDWGGNKGLNLAPTRIARLAKPLPGVSNSLMSQAFTAARDQRPSGRPEPRCFRAGTRRSRLLNPRFPSAKSNGASGGTESQMDNPKNAGSVDPTGRIFHEIAKSAGHRFICRCANRPHGDAPAGRSR